MENIDTEKRIWIVLRYHALESVILVQKKYSRTFGGDPPSRWTITQLLKQCTEHRLVARRPCNRNPSVQTEEPC